jgi:uncharacterized protein YkwD
MLSSRIPLQIAAPKHTRHAYRRSAVLFVVLAAGAIATTSFRQGSAHAERPSTTKSVTEVLSALPAQATLTSVADVQKELNARRVAKGLPELAFDDWMLGPTAQKWSENMADTGNVLHDPQLVSDYQDGWKTLSESVAAGGTADAALATILADPHQAAQLFGKTTATAGVGLSTTPDGTATFLVVRLVA